MLTAHISANFIASRAGELPRYKYSTLRGALGHALRRTICIKRQATCDTCSLITTCPYTMIFDNQHTQSEFLPLVSYSASQQTTFEEGDTLPLEITLIGSQASRFASYVYLALAEMAPNGFGVKRIPFTLDAPPNPRIEHLDFAPLPAGRYRLTLASPLRAKSGSKLSRDMNLEKILNLAIKRLQMAYQYEQAPLPPAIPTDFSVQENSCSLNWFDVERYSNRQATKMNLGGFVGTIDYTDHTGSAATLLRELGKLHVGKQTTFGYGKIEQEAL